MKKFLAIAVVLVMLVSIMSVGASALDLSKKLLRPQIWLQDQVEWAWKECREEGAAEAPLVALGETREVVLTDFSDFKTLNSTGGFQYGIQICDETLSTTEAGDTSTIGFTISDITYKAEGYDDIVVPIAGSYVKDLATKQYDWGVGDNNANFNDEVTKAISAVIGTNGADIFAYFSALTSVSYTITYDSYNGETATGAAAETEPEETKTEEATASETTPTETTPAETTPAETTPTENKAPATGLTLAVVPAVIALAAAVVSKRR